MSINDSIEPDRVEVALINMPIEYFRSASAHNDELFREFRLIVEAEELDTDSVPVRLMQLVRELDEHFTGLTAGVRAQLEEAVAHGDDRIDLRFLVPPQSRSNTIRLAQLLEEADSYCREGDLLTLAPSATEVEFRRWYIGEFIRQLAGDVPRPWTGQASLSESAG